MRWSTTEGCCARSYAVFQGDGAKEDSGTKRRETDQCCRTREELAMEGAYMHCRGANGVRNGRRLALITTIDSRGKADQRNCMTGQKRYGISQCSRMIEGLTTEGSPMEENGASDLRNDKRIELIATTNSQAPPHDPGPPCEGCGKRPSLPIQPRPCRLCGIRLCVNCAGLHECVEIGTAETRTCSASFLSPIHMQTDPDICGPPHTCERGTQTNMVQCYVITQTQDMGGASGLRNDRRRWKRRQGGKEVGDR